jgi:peptidoglycan-N-acetylglucosamine deacetylase
VGSAVEQALAEFTTGTVSRFAGATRFETAAQLATDAFAPGVGTVYVATGLDWPDACRVGRPRRSMRAQCCWCSPTPSTRPPLRH